MDTEEQSDGDNEESNDNEYWFQEVLAYGLKIGLSKKEILDDYYPGELEIVLSEYAKLYKVKDNKNDSDALEALGF